MVLLNDFAFLKYVSSLEIPCKKQRLLNSEYSSVGDDSFSVPYSV